MTYRYRYLGDLPTVFIHLRDDNGTWTPSKDDEIEWHEAVQHPLLELVGRDNEVTDAEPEELTDSGSDPQEDSSVIDDEKEELQ